MLASLVEVVPPVPQLQLPRNRRRRRPPLPAATLSKQAHRFLTSLSTAAAVADDDPSRKLIRKFVQSSSKSIAFNALSHLLSPNASLSLSSLALPLYSEISEAAWFNWNPKIISDLASLLYRQGQANEAQNLVSNAISKLQFRERDLAQFYCNLIESYSTHKLKPEFYDSYTRLKTLIRNSPSSYVKRCGYKSMISGLCMIDSPIEAEKLMEEMMVTQLLKPSMFEYRCLIYAYGRLGLFNDMKRCLVQMENEGFMFDTVSSNMVISSLGAHEELSEMTLWLKRMKKLGIEFSIRTYNSVLNSCPTIMTLLGDIQSVPISIRELIDNLTKDEGLLVEELITSSVFERLLEWNSTEGKLDLHGLHLGSAYLVMLQWRDNLRTRCRDEDSVIPVTITVVCGLGKHSAVVGQSPVKGLIKRMIIRMNCPLRIDRKNVGCFIGKGKVLKEWSS